MRERPSTAMTILVVEEEPQVRLLLGSALRAKGYGVLEAESFERAIELAKGLGEEIDLLVTGLVLASQSGPELFARLRAAHPDLRVLYISGYTASLIEDQALLERGIGVLPRSFTISALAAKVEQSLSVDRARAS